MWPLTQQPPLQNLTESRILAGFWPARLQRSQNLGGLKLTEILAEISKPQQPKTCRESRLDLGEISQSRWDSRRELGEISESQAEILAKISKSWRLNTRRDLTISAAKNSPRILARFQVRSWQDLKVLAVKNLLKISARFAEISKSWRPKHLTKKTGRYFTMSTLRSR